MQANSNKLLHALLAQTNLQAQKQTLVQSFSDGRTDSSTQLTDAECTQLINYLRKQVPLTKPDANTFKLNKQRRKIIALAWQMQWTQNIVEPNGNIKSVCDIARINAWCVKYGYLHKTLNEYTLTEIPKLITQFQKAYNDYLKAV